MVCYHTPKSISLDIFELLITATQTNTHKQIRHPTPHSNKHSVTLPTPLLPPNHNALGIKLKDSKVRLSLSLSLLYSSFLNLSFFTIFETQTSIFFSSSFSLFFFSSSFWNPRHSHIAPLSSFVFFPFLKPVPFSLSFLILKPTTQSHSSSLS